MVARIAPKPRAGGRDASVNATAAKNDDGGGGGGGIVVCRVVCDG